MIIIPYKNKMNDSINEIFINVVEDMKKCLSNDYDFNLALRFICKGSRPERLVKALIYDEINVLLEDEEFYIKEYFTLTKWYKECRNNSRNNRVLSINKLKLLLEEMQSLQDFIPQVWEPDERDLQNKRNFKDYLDITFKNIIELNYIFEKNISYDAFKCSYRLPLLKGMDITVCPYCNKNELIISGSWNSADLDHFLPQSKYPLFSLSLGNLIPACKDCNRQHKKARSIGLNPRFEGFEKQCNFCLYTDENPVVLLSRNYRANNLEILFDIKTTSEENFINICNSMNLFKLYDIYNQDITRDIAYRLLINLSHFKHLQLDLYEQFGLTKEEVFEAQFNLNAKDFKDENYCSAPRGKFIGDVLRSLKTEELVELLDL